jgi:peptide/nickel transport system substrate-binding protein
MRTAAQGFARIAVVVFLSACTFGGSPAPSPSGTSTLSAGGTLRVGLLISDSQGGHCGMRLCGQPFDPQSDTVPAPFEVTHCCLMRTLLSTNGRTVGERGTTLQPDLASELPTVSSDGMTWTFHLKSGLRYAPPMQNTEIVAADFVRSFERALSPATTANQYWYPDGTIGGYFVDLYLPDVIDGASAFSKGEATSISGFEAPDDHTLVVHTTRPTGDLGYRLSQPQLGPIPANPARPADRFGVAQGHPGDYGDFIVSSGPYMFQGSGALDFSKDPLEQRPPDGDGIAGAVLVRNPSWSRSSDPLHAAVPDRIELYPVPDVETADRLVRSGALDLDLDWAPDSNSIDRWLGRPDLRERMHVTPGDEFTHVSLNTAMPPLDDVDVRRAINAGVDRESLVHLLDSPSNPNRNEPFTHTALDSLEDNLLLNYSPPGVEPRANLEAARSFMAGSRYDRDADGRCDAAACKGIELWVERDRPEREAAARAFAAQLAPIGLGIEVRQLPENDLLDPQDHRAMVMIGWAKDFPSASTFLLPLFGVDGIGGGGLNASLLGATPALLRRFGYTVRSVPSVEDRIAECAPQLFQAQVRCYAAFDQYLSEQVVPVVPIAQTFFGHAVSERVRDFTVDAMVGVPPVSIGALGLDGDAPQPAPTPPTPSPPPGMPSGLYRTTITERDGARLGLGSEDAAGFAGTYVITLDSGRFEIHGFSQDHVIWDPITIGTYAGTGHTVRFDVTAPYGGFSGSPLRWTMAGDGLRFTMAGCRGPAARDPGLCAIERATYTTHPWVLVPE